MLIGTEKQTDDVFSTCFFSVQVISVLRSLVILNEQLIHYRYDNPDREFDYVITIAPLLRT